MHILIIPSERYIPQEKLTAGIFQHDQAHALKRAGLQIGVIAPAPRSLRLFKKRLNGWPSGIEFSNKDGVPVYRYKGWGWIPGRTPYLSGKFYTNIGKRLIKKYINEQGMPDIIHAHNALYAGFIAYTIKKKYHIPFVLTEHSSAYIRNGIRGWQVKMVKKVLEKADARVIVSPYLGKEIEKRFGNLVCPWKYIPNILDNRFEKQRSSGSQVPESKELFRFLNVGSLISIKNHIELLNAFSSAFKGLKKVKLLIIGDGPLRKELEALVEILEITTQVQFFGEVNREKILYEMGRCNIFILPSLHETFGVVLIEALACGKPVITTDSGGPRCIINEENGILVPKGDYIILAKVMKKMMQNISNYNSDLIRKDCITRFGEKAVVTQLVEVYNYVVLKNQQKIMEAE